MKDPRILIDEPRILASDNIRHFRRILRSVSSKTLEFWARNSWGIEGPMTEQGSSDDACIDMILIAEFGQKSFQAWVASGRLEE